MQRSTLFPLITPCDLFSLSLFFQNQMVKYFTLSIHNLLLFGTYFKKASRSLAIGAFILFQFHLGYFTESIKWFVYFPNSSWDMGNAWERNLAIMLRTLQTLDRFPLKMFGGFLALRQMFRHSTRPYFSDTLCMLLGIILVALNIIIFLSFYEFQSKKQTYL